MIVEATLAGVTRLLMHNGQLSDPLNEWSEAIADHTGKKKKTRDDHLQISRLEWYGGLWLDDSGRPHIPSDAVQAVFWQAAKLRKKGKDALVGFVPISDTGGFPLIYNGPKTADALWESGKFKLRKSLRLKTARVQRTRACFNEWSVVIRADVADDIFDRRGVTGILENAGRFIGLGDSRPVNGRFVVKDIDFS